MADISPKNTTVPQPGMAPARDFKVESSIQQLHTLQQQITELRHRMPSLLRSLATIQDTESTQTVFGRTAKEATLLQSKVDEFVQCSRQSHEIFNYIEARKREIESGGSGGAQPQVKVESQPPVKMDGGDQLGMDDLGVDMMDFDGGNDETSALFDEMYNG